ncbi:MAG: SUMF1/EgtB/PvdO family nonheme iron enzyme [Bacteroidia bacterium]
MNHRDLFMEEEPIAFCPEGQNYVLAIAIDEYQKEGCPKLENAVNDAVDFLQILLERYQFEEQNITRLFNEAATRQAILSALKHLTKMVTEKDNVIIYYSGHGRLFHELDEGYWIPVEASANDDSSQISNAELLTYIEKGIKSFHTILIADCCYSGSLLDATRNIIEERVMKLPSRWGMASGRKELVADGAIGKNSPFNTAIVNILRENPYPMLRFTEIGLKAEVITANNAAQTPLYSRMRGDQGGEFVFVLKNHEEIVWGNIQLAPSLLAYQKYLATYPQGKFVAEANEAILQLTVTETVADINETQGENSPETNLEAMLWLEVKRRKTVSDYKKYLLLYPQGTFAVEAKDLLEQLVWLEAANVHTVLAYQTYLRQYPAGKFANEAKISVQALAPRLPAAIQGILDNMLFLEGGAFTMGDTFDEGEADTLPIHEVTLSDFHLGKYPITKVQFRIFIDETKYVTDAEKKGGSHILKEDKWITQAGINWQYNTKGELCTGVDDEHPVCHLSWNDAQAFCKWLSEKTGEKFRLPTEAEWEYAARGGKMSQNYRYAGSNIISDVAWYTQNSNGIEHAVGELKPNELGLYDMSGNVWEWCSDAYLENFYANSPASDPKCDVQGEKRVLRGGSWYNPEKSCVVSHRGKNKANASYGNASFRIAR